MLASPSENSVIPFGVFYKKKDRKKDICVISWIQYSQNQM